MQLNDELIVECTAREFVNRVQNMRKDADLEVADRIHVGVQGEPDLLRAIEVHREYIGAEILALGIRIGELPEEAFLEQEWQVNGFVGTVAIARA